MPHAACDDFAYLLILSMAEQNPFRPRHLPGNTKQPRTASSTNPPGNQGRGGWHGLQSSRPSRGRGYGSHNSNSITRHTNKSNPGHGSAQPPRTHHARSATVTSSPRNPVNQERINRGIHFKHLLEISNMEPNDILLKLSEYSRNFQTLLIGNTHPNCIILIVKCLTKVCQITFDVSKNSILKNAFNSIFSKTLLQYILSLPYATKESKVDNNLFWDDRQGFLSNLLDISENLFDVTCLTVDPRVFMDAVSLCITGLRKYHSESKDDDSEVYDKFNSSLSTMKQTYEDVNKPLSAHDFRRIDVIPKYGELITRGHVFLRPIIVNGAYPSVDHYLDVQFRLMREDFVSPLREGIIDYIEDPTSRKYNNIRFYRRAKFLKYSFSRDNVGVLVNFDGKWTGNRNFQKNPAERKMYNSKRFLYGSLLCFTDDNFQNIIFSTVVNRDDIDLGLITVAMDGFYPTGDMLNKTYLMVESEIYFLPYHHILKTLKDRSLQKNFPMKKYIIDVEPCEVNPECISATSSYDLRLPKTYKHGRNMVRNMAYNMLVLSDTEESDDSSNDITEEADHRRYIVRVPVLTHDEWPTAQVLGLDNTQYEALKMALTREFVTIQGPPGTGKTFLALKVAETMLRNDECMSTSPMLVVCYTNHALDQFLEGILKAMNWTPGNRYSSRSKMVRIGGQSKSEVLSQFKLSALRRNKDNFQFRRNLIELSEGLNNLQSTIDFIDSNEGILNVAQFSEYLNFDVNKFLSGYNRDEHRFPIASWLLMGNDSSSVAGFKWENTPGDESAKVNGGDYDESDNVHRPIMDVDEDLFVSKDPNNFFNVRTLAHNFYKCREQYQIMIQDENAPPEAINNQLYWIKKLGTELNLFKDQLRNCVKKLTFPMSVPNKSANLYSCGERWMFYWQWINALKQPLNKALMMKMAKFQSEKTVCDELLMAADYDILRHAKVIGITTTGAAQQQALLKALKSRIVIVEEAAEVMESHIVASLTSACKHLILIGDHLQLKPMTATYRLAKHFNLDLSLFERMVKNGSHCYQLNVQHRMRPEFANLITPTIYANLLNDPCVEIYKPICGTTKNLYFIDHQFPETSGDEQSSRLNTHECDFLLSLARYFIHHQYQPNDITILVTYTGQMFHMRREKKHYPELDSVRIINVDNFQGEESKIILLSLVRSNEEAKIGFLSTPNRVCVALSRAKEGFFIVGNMSNLTQSSDIWKQINKTLVNQGAVGPSLTLKCENHSGVLTQVKSKKDFDLVSLGGCDKDCNTLLECGHYCKMKCHVLDTEHKNYMCMEKCEKSCPFDHPCLLRCNEKCRPCSVLVKKTLPCGHVKSIQCCQNPLEAKCLITVTDVTLPLCSHKTSKLCYEDIANVPCATKCIDRLQCGHVCTRNCHKKSDPDHEQFICHMPCTLKNEGCSMDHPCPKECHEKCDTCTIVVDKKRDKCPHSDKTACSVDINETKCMKKCSRVMKCTHFCKQLCHQPCNTCDVKVPKPRFCGHIVKAACSGNADSVPCESKCERILACGHPCKKLCSAECDVAVCQALVENVFQSLCGHKFLVPCNQSKIECEKASFLLMMYCKEKCDHVLKGCDHKCKGTCGQCLGGRLHMPCQENCGHLLVCGHSCKQPCRESCPPCKQMCEVKCEHSKCPLPCGVQCRPCKMKCGRRCEHGKCSKLCGETCNWAPCSEPCKQTLKCQHPCRGLCGELCPPVCKICDPKSVPEILFGNEDDEDARFIKLVDCPHSVEVDGLDTWVMDVKPNESQKISIRPCPYCSTPIVNTPRYLDLVRKSLRQIGSVKTKTFGNVKTIEAKLTNLRTNFNHLLQQGKAMEKVTRWRNLILDIQDKIKKNMPLKLNKFYKKRDIRISLQDVEKYSSVVHILGRIAALFQKSENALTSPVVMFQINNLITCIEKTGTTISLQQGEDFTNELLRTEHILQGLSVEIACKTQMKEGKEADVKSSFAVINDMLFSAQVYTDVLDHIVNEEFEKLKGCVSIQLTQVERKAIVAAMGLKQGHWYACPNGHFYCIGDCGGANQEAVCPECKAKIGGTSHRLISSNRLAPEMDGAKHSAWSDAAQLGNYDLQ